MGWYSFVPFMECKHGVVSMHHTLKGGLHIGDTYVDFNDGSGCIAILLILLKPPLPSRLRKYPGSVNAIIELKLSDRSGNTLFHDRGTGAGMELIEKNFAYF